MCKYESARLDRTQRSTSSAAESITSDDALSLSIEMSIVEGFDPVFGSLGFTSLQFETQQ